MFYSAVLFAVWSSVAVAVVRLVVRSIIFACLFLPRPHKGLHFVLMSFLVQKQNCVDICTY